VYVTTA